MTKRTKQEIVENIETIMRENKNNKYCSTTELIVLIMNYLIPGPLEKNEKYSKASLRRKIANE